MIRTKVHKSRRRGTAIYVMVMATALLVSVLGICSLEQIRIQRAKSELSQDRIKASALAYSAVGLGLRALEKDSEWRSNISNGEVSDPIAVMNDANSLVYWVVEDSDGDLSDADTLLSISGVGRRRDALQVASVDVLETETISEEELLRSYDNPYDFIADDALDKDEMFGQYVVPTLPPGATAWKITSVEFRIMKRASNKDFSVNTYKASSSNTPEGSPLETVMLESNDTQSFISSLFKVNLSADVWHDATEGICITMETDENSGPVYVYFDKTVSNQVGAGLLEYEEPGGWAFYSNKSYYYQISGVYKDGQKYYNFVEGTWRRGDVP